MATTMLHLVDDQGEPVATEVRIAVEGAFRYLLRRGPEIDEVILAELAETLALTMNLRLSTIVTPKSYAQTALFGEVNDWIRTHKGFEIPVAETKDLEHLARGTAGKGIGVDPEYEILFSQIRKHLTERDRHILVLLEQNLHKPKEIAAALHISYDAAAKALQRVRERIAQILNGTRNTGAVNADLPTGRPARKHLK